MPGLFEHHTPEVLNSWDNRAYTGIIGDDTGVFLVQRGIQVGAHKHAGASKYIGVFKCFLQHRLRFCRYFARRDVMEMTRSPVRAELYWIRVMGEKALKLITVVMRRRWLVVGCVCCSLLLIIRAKKEGGVISIEMTHPQHRQHCTILFLLH